MKERRKLRQRTYKAALAMALATGSLVTLSPPNALAADVNEKSFSDVQASQHFYEAVKNLTARGIISGFEDGTFRPSENISRAHAAKIMALALGLDTKNVKNPEFKDVSTSHPNYEAIAALVEAGVLKGYENNTFHPDGNLTRAQMAKMLVKGFKFEEEKYSNLPFDDVKNNEWHANYIQTLFDHKITTGKTASKYDPNAYVTRGQAASFIYRTEATKKQEAVLIQNISNNELTVSDGTYAIPKSFANILSESNLAILKGSHIKYTVKDKEIDNISYIEIQASGTANNYLVLDGKGDKFNGELSTNGNFITIKNILLASLQIKQGTTSVTVDAKVEKLKVQSKNTKVTLGTNAKIGDLLLPAGTQAKDIIPNYDKVKANIEKINGVANPDAKPVTPPSSGGGGSGGGGGNTNPPTKPEDKNFDLSIMHFNDTHAHLDNAAKRVTAVNEVRAAKPNSLLLDAGDVFSGTLYFNEFKGQADLEFMNLMKVDAMTFGNHEFDLGSSPEGHKALADFIKAANFPFVSANVDFSKDGLFTGLFNTKIADKPEKANIYSGIVKEVNGEKIGIFGLTTAETKDISSPGKIEFSNYIDDAKKMVAEFEKMGVNKIVAITHIGYDDNPAVDNDMELAKAVEGIDVIVGGHSHTQLDKPVLVSKNAQPTIIVQAYQYADFLGTLDVTFDKNGVIVGHAGKLIKVADKAADPAAAEILKKYSDRIKDISNEETGAIAVNALENPRSNANSSNSVRSNETPLGNVITDGMLSKAKVYNKNVVMAFQNGGGIRSAINQGPITVGEVITVLPFGNTLATMELTGAEIKETFEISFKELPRENGGFLHVSGAKVKYDSSKPVGQRVVSIAYKNAEGSYTEIQDTQKYTIATNAFTAKGGDGYTVLAKAYAEGRVTDLGLSDWENFSEHLVSLGNVDPKVEGRIVDVKDEDPNNEYPGGNIDEDDFSGTVEVPKVYNGDVTVSVTEVSFLGNAIIKGNLTITGNPSNNMTLSNITVKGNLDLSGLNGETLDLDGIIVDGETIF
ncbi:S-layer homology domain-containing protein [Psychrobacillus sp. INOP01]|nr:S-layer homology domain-containing protein [Psychrobacillus sp. INOP01]QUG40573.1 S-layer homology domain-containing protein [Psychrobacillus sp. INOP01]